MLLKHRIVSLPKAKEHVKVEPEEDAWLNDAGSSSQAQPSQEGAPELPPPQQKKDAAMEQAAPVSQSQSYIKPGDPLWPIVLRLSERIWRELYQNPGISSTPEALLTTFVQKRVIDLLREEPKLAQQVQDIAEAKLLALGAGAELARQRLG